MALREGPEVALGVPVHLVEEEAPLRQRAAVRTVHAAPGSGAGGAHGELVLPRVARPGTGRGAGGVRGRDSVLARGRRRSPAAPPLALSRGAKWGG